MWLQRAIAFHLVCLGWVFFRADSIGHGRNFAGAAVTGWAEPTVLVTPCVRDRIALTLGLQFVAEDAGGIREELARGASTVAVELAAALTLFAITTIGPQGVAPFIYFQF